MTPAAATEVAQQISSSFDWPEDAGIVAYRLMQHSDGRSVDGGAVEFAVLLPGASPETVETIEWCFKNGLVFEGQRRPYRVVVFAELDAAPEADGWIQVAA